MPSNEPTPTFHHAIAKDIPATFKIFERDEGSNNARMVTFELLQKLVKSMGDSGEYELVDTSFTSLQGFPKFYDAPLECLIVDKSRPEGLSPSHGIESLPTPYDAIALSSFLSGNGYDGTLIESRPDVVGYDATNAPNLDGPALLQPETPWSSLHLSSTNPLSSLFPILPPTLRVRPQQHSQNQSNPDPDTTNQEYCESDVNGVKQVTSPASDIESHTDLEIEIHLSPAHPSRPLRWSLLRATAERSPAFRTLMSVFWLWVRTQGMRELWSWETCASIVMFYMQVHHKLPNQASSDGTPSQGFWNRLDFEPEPTYERMDAPVYPIPNFVEPASELGPVLHGFFDYLASLRYLSYNQIFSPLTGAHVTRKRKYRANGKDLDEASVLNSLQAQAQNNVKDALWEYQPLVLVDPFLPYHNVAHSVTKHALQMMFYKARLAALAIKNGQPIMEIFDIKISEKVPQFERKNGVQQRETNQLTLGGRRLYHSSAVANAPRPLELEEQDVFPIAKVPASVLSARSQTIQRVQSAIQRRYGNEYKVGCFGSTQYGVDSSKSDLDLVVLDPQRTKGFTPDVDINNLPVVYNIRSIAYTLKKSGFRIIQVVSFATVPIVKFEDPKSHISCDININDQLGLYNTHLIASYCSLSPILRPLLVLLKKWAKSLGLNDPSGEKGTATFSSYALTLMTIGFLQTHDQLPNLQARLQSLSDGDEFWMKAKTGERIRCDARFDRMSSWTPPDDVIKFELRYALYAWFQYWGHQYNYAQDVMSIRDGGVILRTEKAITTVSWSKQEKRRLKTRKQYEKVKGKGKKIAQKISPARPSNDSAEGQKAIGEDVDDPNKAALEEISETDVAHGKQPHTWSLAALVVADPFIVSKNTTGAITVRAIERFTAECRRSLLLLSHNAPFYDLLGDSTPIVFPVTPRGRGRLNRNGGKGKTNNVVPPVRGRGRDKEDDIKTHKRSSYERRIASKNRERDASKDRAKVRTGVQEDRQDDGMPNYPREEERRSSQRRSSPSLSGRVEVHEGSQDMEPSEGSRTESRTRTIAELKPNSSEHFRQRSRERMDATVPAEGSSGSNAKAGAPRRQNQSYGKKSEWARGPPKVKGLEGSFGQDSKWKQ